MPGLDSFLYGGVSAGASAAQSSRANKKVRDFNRIEAKKARTFSAKQSATVAQRGVADLKAAGLNPILAATSFGGGSAASGGSGASAPQEQTTAATTGLAGARQSQEIKNMKATAELTGAQKTKVDLEAIGQDQVNIIRGPAADLGAAVGTVTGAARGNVEDSNIIERIINSRPAAVRQRKKNATSKKKHSGSVITAPRISTSKMRKR